MYKRPEERNTHVAVESHGGGGGAAITIEELDALVVRVSSTTDGARAAAAVVVEWWAILIDVSPCTLHYHHGAQEEEGDLYDVDIAVELGGAGDQAKARPPPAAPLEGGSEWDCERDM